MLFEIIISKNVFGTKLKTRTKNENTKSTKYKIQMKARREKLDWFFIEKKNPFRLNQSFDCLNINDILSF